MTMFRFARFRIVVSVVSVRRDLPSALQHVAITRPAVRRVSRKEKREVRREKKNAKEAKKEKMFLGADDNGAARRKPTIRRVGSHARTGARGFLVVPTNCFPFPSFQTKFPFCITRAPAGSPRFRLSGRSVDESASRSGRVSLYNVFSQKEEEEEEEV